VQVATQVFRFFNVPTCTIVVVVSAVIGVPILARVRLVYELTPHGLKRESDIDPASRSRVTPAKLDRWYCSDGGGDRKRANQFTRARTMRCGPVGAPEKSIAELPSQISDHDSYSHRHGKEEKGL